MLHEGSRPSLRDRGIERILTSVNTGLEYRSPKQKLKPTRRESRSTYLKRRTVVGGLVIGVVGVAAAVGSHFVQEEPAQDCTPITHTVKPGDTLWKIGEAAHPKMDPREAVSIIEDANASINQVIRPGDNIKIPCK